MIKPSIGRVVLYTRNAEDRVHPAFQPHPAFIDYVHDDRTVDLTAFRSGSSFAASRVALLQDDDAVPTTGRFAEWMPYQKEQAAKAAVAVPPAA